MEKLVISPREASELTGFPSTAIKELMKRKLIDVGVIKPPLKIGGHKRYYIYKEKLLREVGVITNIFDEYENSKNEKEETKQEKKK